MTCTDEKIFTNNGYCNPQKDVICAEDRESFNQRRGLYGETVMVVMGVTLNGLTQAYFFDKGLRLLTNKYFEVLTFLHERRQ